MRIKIDDPFIPGRFFEVDPEAVVKRCVEIHRATQWPTPDGGFRPHVAKNHRGCPHCAKIREHVMLLAEAELLMDALAPVNDPDTVAASLEFMEMAKPWGASCAGPEDTQPFDPVKPNAAPPPGFDPDETLKSHRGFELKEDAADAEASES
jgi:hypothetical protein